jgi:flagellar basal body-associated protein FliL
VFAIGPCQGIVGGKQAGMYRDGPGAAGVMVVVVMVAIAVAMVVLMVVVGWAGAAAGIAHGKPHRKRTGPR